MRPQGPDHIAPVPNRIFAGDQRSSFLRDYLGIPKGTKPRRGEIRLGKRVKDKIIGEGFNLAVDKVTGEGAIPGLLIDEQFADGVIKRNIAKGRSVGIPVEVSGRQYDFALEYPDDFEGHVIKYENGEQRPAFVKALINWNVDMTQGERETLFSTLRNVAKFAHERGYPLMAEVLIPANDDQKAKVGGTKDNYNKDRYDREIRPDLEVKMIADFNEQGIPIDVWKIEGMEEVSQYNAVLEKAAKGGNGAKVIVLGRNASNEQLRTWLTAAAQAEYAPEQGEIQRIFGFAIGRSIWGELVKTVLAETRNDAEHRNLRRDLLHHPIKWARENIAYTAIKVSGRRKNAEKAAAEEAAERYLMFNDMFTNARAEHLQAQAEAATEADIASSAN